MSSATLHEDPLRFRRRDQVGREGALWEATERLLFPVAGGRNIALAAVDRHVEARDGGCVALRLIDDGTPLRDVTYRELQQRSKQLANVFAGFSVAPRDRVFTLLPYGDDLVVAALAAWRVRAVFAPLAPTTAPALLRRRLSEGRARVLVTTRRLYERARLGDVRRALPLLARVILVDDGEPAAHAGAGTSDLRALLGQCGDVHEAPPTDAQEPALLHFVDDGRAVMHSHRAALVDHATAAPAFGLQPGARLWYAPDAGGVAATCYGVIAALTHRAMSIVIGAPGSERGSTSLSAERCLRILDQHAVGTWVTTPAALVALAAAPATETLHFDLAALRVVAVQAGAGHTPLPVDVLRTAEERLGVPVRLVWGAPELGAIALAPAAHATAPTGSVGRPVPGLDVALVQHGPRGIEIVGADDVVGEIAVNAMCPTLAARDDDDGEQPNDGAPSHDGRQPHDGTQAATRCRDGWFLSGEFARRDRDGNFWLTPAPS